MNDTEWQTWLKSQYAEAEEEAAFQAKPKTNGATYPTPITPPPPEPKSWPGLGKAALYGLPGEIVQMVSPHSEADPVAILAQYLVAAGNAIGHDPYYLVEGDRHPPNLFAVLVGDTAKGRKGTSWGRVRQIMAGADPQWTRERIQSGLSSGEGVIWAVRDPIMGFEKRGKGDSAERIEVEIDPGIRDKRLMIVEPEYERALAVIRRDGSTLSGVIRDAWDRGDLSSLTKNSPARATGAHVSIIGHITTDELRASLDRVSMANGSANRVLWLMVRRARELPFGGALETEIIAEFGRRTREAIEAASNTGRVTMSAEAKQLWRAVYHDLSQGKPGLLGAIIGRAEAQTIRLALVYALLDGRAEIATEHLNAALALWRYAEASAEFIWGDALGDPIADEILRVLRIAGADGKTRTEIRDLFGRHRAADEIGAALSRLLIGGKAACLRRETGGRPVELWTATGSEK